MGVTEQLIFPEIDYDKVDKIRGMDITFVTSAKTDDEAKALLDPSTSRSSDRRNGDSTPRLGGLPVAKKSMIAKAKREAEVLGAQGHPLPALRDDRAPYYRQFGLCRICLREMASRGELPGIRKASW